MPRLSTEQRRLVEAHPEIGRRVALKMIRHGLRLESIPGATLEDVIQIANEGVCLAASRWNRALGAGNFGAFAGERARWAIIDWMRLAGQVTRHGVERLYEVPFVEDQTDNIGDGPLPTENRLRAEDLEQSHEDEVAASDLVRQALDLLDGRERYVMEEMLVKGRTEAEIARVLGITESRVSQLRAKALNRIRRDDDVLYAATS